MRYKVFSSDEITDEEYLRISEMLEEVLNEDCGDTEYEVVLSVLNP